jgi:hypothetical protein
MLRGPGGGSGGVTSVNSQTGAVTIQSSGGSITVTEPSAGVINLESVSGGSGTVTSVSVVTANGFAGTVANATSTPAITIKTGVTGILKGNGTAVSAAVGDTDYQNPITLTTTGTSGAATFSGDTLNIPEYAGRVPQSIFNTFG